MSECRTVNFPKYVVIHKVTLAAVGIPSLIVGVLRAHVTGGSLLLAIGWVVLFGALGLLLLRGRRDQIPRE